MVPFRTAGRPAGPWSNGMTAESHSANRGWIPRGSINEEARVDCNVDAGSEAVLECKTDADSHAAADCNGDAGPEAVVGCEADAGSEIVDADDVVESDTAADCDANVAFADHRTDAGSESDADCNVDAVSECNVDAVSDCEADAVSRVDHDCPAVDAGSGTDDCSGGEAAAAELMSWQRELLT